MRSIVVVGASLAGLTAARTLREAGYDGSLVLVGAEDEPPYDRPPLSKAYLAGAAERRDLALLGPNDDALAIEWRLGRRATGLDPVARQLTLDDGSVLTAEGVILATGGVARQPAGWAGEGVHVLRSRADADALRAELTPGRRLVIVGAGFIGAEVATVARTLGCDVTMVGLEGVPLERFLGPVLGAALVPRYRELEITLVMPAAVTGPVRSSGRLEAVELADGLRLPADVVLVAVGSAPATSWLEGSGLELADGVVCGPDGATGIEGIVAVGDCAAPIRADGVARRDEHWTAAMRAAESGALRLLAGPGGDREPEPPPYVWSDQLGLELQMAGALTAADGFIELAAEGPTAPFAGGELLAGALLGAVVDRRLVGLLGVSQPRLFTRWRRRIGEELTPL